MADRCVGCGGDLQSMGVERFRVGGTSGGWKLLFGEMAELGEETLPLQLLACERCRRVEARVPGGDQDAKEAERAQPVVAPTPEAPTPTDSGGPGAEPSPPSTPSADAGYQPGMKLGATLLTIFMPFIAVVAALVMLGNERSPIRRAFLRTWAWISAGVLALGLVIAISVVASVAGTKHHVDTSGPCVGGPAMGEPGVSLGNGRYRFRCEFGGTTVVNLGGTEPPAP